MIVYDVIRFFDAGPVDKVAALVRDVNGHGTWNRTLQVRCYDTKGRCHQHPTSRFCTSRFTMILLAHSIESAFPNFFYCVISVFGGTPGYQNRLKVNINLILPPCGSLGYRSTLLGIHWHRV